MNALAPTHWTGTTLEPAPHLWTLDEVVEMRRVGVLAECGRYELLDGEIIDMPPEGELHAWFKVSLSNTLCAALIGRGLWVAVETRLAFAERDAPVPDLYVMPQELTFRDTPGGELLLLVEVADSTLTHDTGRKAAKYAVNGVTEYWVVDVRSRRTLVHARPENGEFLDRTAVSFSEPLRAARLEGVEVVIADLPGFDTLKWD